jgi:hypothetical protein
MKVREQSYGRQFYAHFTEMRDQNAQVNVAGIAAASIFIKIAYGIPRSQFGDGRRG